MLAVWWHRGPAEAPTAVQPPGRPMQYRTRDPLGKLRHIHICSLRPIRQWPCLTRSGPVADQVAAVALAAEGREAGVAGPEVVVGVALAARVGPAAPVAKAGPAARVGPVARAGPAELPLAVAGRAVALAPTILMLITTIRRTTSRGQSFRHFHRLLRPTNKFWLR